MTIQETISRLLHKNNRTKEILDERRAERLAVQRDKNSNERELERFMEEERQKNIKIQLEHYRKKRNNEINKAHLLRHDKNIIAQKPLFKGTSTILKEKRSFLR